MIRINISEFKATCLRLLEEIRTTGQPLEVLKNGEPIVVVYPSTSKKRVAGFGAMKETVVAEVGDLISPVDDIEWNAMK